MSQPPKTATPIQKHDPYAAFRIPAFRFYMLGSFLANLGVRIQSTAIAWEMYQRTGEPLALGLVGLAQALPTMLLALPAGYLADKYSRPRLVMLSLWAMTMTSAGLAYLSFTEGSTNWMYILLFLDAAVVMLGRPARSALVPQLVPTAVFPNAVTWNMSLMQIAGVLGPAIGGLIVAFHVPSAYLITALTSGIFIVMLAQLNFKRESPRPGTVSLQTLFAGIHFVWNTRIIFTMITLDLFAVLLGGAVYLLPVYAESILNVGAAGYGWLRAAPAVGSFAMAALLIYMPPMQRAGWSLLLNVGAFGVATIIFGFSESFWLSFVMLFLTGAFDNVSMVVRQTLQQLLTPDHMRGRVSAVTSVFVGASNELGGFESGLVAQWFGPVFSVVSGGIGTLFVVGAAAWLSPELRRLGALHEARPVETLVTSEDAPKPASA